MLKQNICLQLSYLWAISFWAVGPVWASVSHLFIVNNYINAAHLMFLENIVGLMGQWQRPRQKQESRTQSSRVISKLPECNLKNIVIKIT